MPEKCSISPRPSSAIDAKSIKIPSISTSPEVQDPLPAVHLPDISAGECLMPALWQSPDCVHQIGCLDRHNNKFRNIPVKDAADAVAQAQALSGEGHEVFFACAEYQTTDSRTTVNASGACGFWLDIDCGQDKAATGKGYATLEEAEDALKQFYRDTGLPEPTHIVHSGSGLHAHWVVDAKILGDTWQSHARQL